MELVQHSQHNLNYSDKLRAFIKDVGLPFNRAPEALGLKSSEFLNWWSGQSPEIIKYSQLSSLGDFLSIDENQILNSNYNKELIRSRLFENPLTLPEKYLQNQYSYLRSSAHIIKFLTLNRGQHFSDMIMKKMNVSPLIYSDHNNKISLNYFIDLLEILSANGLAQSELDQLACVLFLSLGNTSLGHKFKKAKNYYECYEVLANNIQLFDSNFSYSFELDKKRFIANVKMDYDQHGHIKWRTINVQRLFRYRLYFVTWFPYLSNLSPIYPQTELIFTENGIMATYNVSFQSELINSPF